MVVVDVGQKQWRQKDIVTLGGYGGHIFEMEIIGWRCLGEPG
jgi:hypothetical protein